MNTLRSITTPAAAVVLVMAVSSSAWLAGCASAPVPREQLAVAEAAVRQANTSSTSEYAPGELQLAIDKLSAAKQAVDQHDNVRAKQLAEQAQVDAQVAEMHAQAMRSGKAAKESESAAQALREELDRKAAP